MATKRLRWLVPFVPTSSSRILGYRGGTGTRSAERSKKNPELGHIPVILLAGAFEPSDPEKVQASGADHLITKPFESATLVERVKMLLTPSDRLPPLDPLLDCPPRTFR